MQRSKWTQTWGWVEVEDADRNMGGHGSKLGMVMAMGPALNPAAAHSGSSTVECPGTGMRTQVGLGGCVGELVQALLAWPQPALDPSPPHRSGT